PIPIVDADVTVTVVIDIAEGGPAARTFFCQSAAALHGNLRKGSIAVVSVQQLALAIVISLRVSVAVGNEQIDPAIVVVIEELSSPAHVRKTYLGHCGLVGNIRERVLSDVAVKDIVFIVEVGNENVEPSVVVIVTHCDAHAPLLGAVSVDRHSRFESDFAKREWRSTETAPSKGAWASQWVTMT